MLGYQAFHRRSIEDRDAFWAEQAQLIDWKVQPTTICDPTSSIYCCCQWCC